MTNFIIEVSDLRKTYQTGEIDVEVLKGATLTVKRGEFLAVIGPSGSGKSTLFHILGGLAAPTAGRVVIDGYDLSNISDKKRTELRQRKIGFIFQKYNLLPTLTAAENIEMARALAAYPRKPANFDQILSMLNISHRLTHKPRALSGGEQQRVAIARALVNDPAILLADEPTGNLDSRNSEAVLEILRTLNKQTGQTILMITHNAEAAGFADRIVGMRDGQLHASA